MLLWYDLLGIISVLNLWLIIKSSFSLKIWLDAPLLNHCWRTCTCWLRYSTVIFSNNLYWLRFIYWRKLSTLLSLNLAYFSALSLNFWRPRIGNTWTLNIHFSILCSSLDDGSRYSLSNDFWSTLFRSYFVSIFDLLSQK